MKAFVAFVVILFLLIGGGLGFWGWGKWNKVEKWGVGLNLNSELKESEMETAQARYNTILDQDDILENAVTAHNLTDYYGVSSKKEAVEKLKEDTFVEIPDNKSMHILFEGKRSSRKERIATVETLSKDFLKRVQELSKK